MTNFFGRKDELKKLSQLLEKKSASLAVIKGRRRIGKSRLAIEFGKKVGKCCVLTGMPPTRNLTDQEEKDDFARQMSRALKIPQFQSDDWGDLFFYLSKETSEGRFLIVLDEINWMGSKDPTFLGKLKTAWDNHFSKNPKLIMILCGSLSGWIEKNILTSSGFVGRISKILNLHELPLPDCDLFWGESRERTSPFDKFKLLSVTGGIPKYLEEINPKISAEQNIWNLCFQEDGFLFREFEQLFHDLFTKRSSKYKIILRALAAGPKGLSELYQALKLKKTGYVVSEYMNDLEEAGFIQRDFTWNLKTSSKSRMSVYRLSDNYARFYLKYIEPNADRIRQNILTKPPPYEKILGLQFENMVLNNRRKVHELLEIDPQSILIDNPYFQTATKDRRGCQIDYMIQIKQDTNTDNCFQRVL